MLKDLNRPFKVLRRLTIQSLEHYVVFLLFSSDIIPSASLLSVSGLDDNPNDAIWKFLEFVG